MPRRQRSRVTGHRNGTLVSQRIKLRDEFRDTGCVARAFCITHLLFQLRAFHGEEISPERRAIILELSSEGIEGLILELTVCKDR